MDLLSSTTASVYTERQAENPSGAAASSSEPTPVPDELREKAEQKTEAVRQIVRNLEMAIRNDRPQDREYLERIIDPQNPCFRTLINLLVAPKYTGFVRLRCVVMRAVQMILKIAVNMVPGTMVPDVHRGMRCLVEMAGEQLAQQAFPELRRLASNHDQAVVACDALLVLAELGPEALEPRLVRRLLDLFVSLPDRAEELVEVALRAHAWGGEARSELLQTAVSHPGGTSLGEVLLQVVNRGDEVRSLRAVKVLTGCLSCLGGQNILYTNDVRVLVEILQRELPKRAEAASEFACYAECLRALFACCDAARQHRHDEVVQLLEDLRDDESCDAAVRAKCAEVLRAATAPIGR